jgi:hypothetical protein
MIVHEHALRKSDAVAASLDGVVRDEALSQTLVRALVILGVFLLQCGIDKSEVPGNMPAIRGRANIGGLVSGAEVQLSDHLKRAMILLTSRFGHPSRRRPMPSMNASSRIKAHSRH